MWVLSLSGAACSCARDGVSRTLLLVSVEVSEARSSMSTVDVDTVHSDERTISLAVIFVFIIYVRFIGIFYYPETPSDLRTSTQYPVMRGMHQHMPLRRPAQPRVAEQAT